VGSSLGEFKCKTLEFYIENAELEITSKKIGRNKSIFVIFGINQTFLLEKKNKKALHRDDRFLETNSIKI
jgi:hypothetical protein